MSTAGSTPDDFHVYDTTLRDGAQQEGLNLSVADKLTIAQRRVVDVEAVRRAACCAHGGSSGLGAGRATKKPPVVTRGQRIEGLDALADNDLLPGHRSSVTDLFKARNRVSRSGRG